VSRVALRPNGRVQTEKGVLPQYGTVQNRYWTVLGLYRTVPYTPDGQTSRVVLSTETSHVKIRHPPTPPPLA
jgi:hypothetical protein